MAHKYFELEKKFNEKYSEQEREGVYNLERIKDSLEIDEEWKRYKESIKRKIIYLIIGGAIIYTLLGVEIKFDKADSNNKYKTIDRVVEK